MTVIKVAACFVAYGVAALAGAGFAFYGVIAAANRLVKPYPTQ